jgi:hypothetical protein
VRRLIVLAIGTAVVGCVVSNLLRTDKDKPVSSVTGPPRDKRAMGDALQRNVVSETSEPSNEDANSNEATFPREETPASLTVDLPPGQADPLEEPANVILLEASRTHRRRASETGDSPPSQPSQNGDARMKRARNAVDQRFQRLPKKGHRRKRGAA